MPRLVNALPKYRHHRPSGQAVVTLSGRDIYLGPYRSQASRHEYAAYQFEHVAYEEFISHRDAFAFTCARCLG